MSCKSSSHDDFIEATTVFFSSTSQELNGFISQPSIIPRKNVPRNIRAISLLASTRV
jgi:hypothetical protein